MKQQWQILATRFDALARRERSMVAAAVLLTLLFLGYSLLIGPQLARRADLRQRIVRAGSERLSVEAQLAGVRAQLADPDVGNRAALLQARASIAVLDAKLRGLGSTLVPPERMQAFLESLLSKNRHLELLALRTLPPTPLIEPAATGSGGDKKTAVKPAAESGPAAPNIYKHGVEIRIAGSYDDLLTYLAELERMPQRILWNRVALTVDKYPRSILTLTVYTLSLDKQWLVV